MTDSFISTNNLKWGLTCLVIPIFFFLLWDEAWKNSCMKFHKTEWPRFSVDPQLVHHPSNNHPKISWMSYTEPWAERSTEPREPPSQSRCQSRAKASRTLSISEVHISREWWSQTQNHGCRTGHLLSSATHQPASCKHILSRADWEIPSAVISGDKPVPEIHDWDALKRNRLSLKTLPSQVFRILHPFSAFRTFREFSDGMLREVTLPRFIFWWKEPTIKSGWRAFCYPLASIHYITGAFPSESEQ